MRTPVERLLENTQFMAEQAQWCEAELKAIGKSIQQGQTQEVDRLLQVLENLPLFSSEFRHLAAVLDANRGFITIND